MYKHFRSLYFFDLDFDCSVKLSSSLDLLPLPLPLAPEAVGGASLGVAERVGGRLGGKASRKMTKCCSS
jgi:hypothetical protein